MIKFHFTECLLNTFTSVSGIYHQDWTIRLSCPLLLDLLNWKWAILPERVHHWRNILSCTAKTSKHLIKKNIGQFICILWPSFDHKNIFDKLNRFLSYRHIKMRQWWNAEFHRFCILIWWYLKNIFSLSRTFCWAKLGQSVWLNCPIFLLAECLLVSAVQDKMWKKKWKLCNNSKISTPLPPTPLKA